MVVCGVGEELLDWVVLVWFGECEFVGVMVVYEVEIFG